MTCIAVGNFSNNTKSKFQPFPDVPIPIKRFYCVSDTLITNLHIVFSAYPVFKKFDFEENSRFFKFNPTLNTLVQKYIRFLFMSEDSVDFHGSTCSIMESIS